MSPHLRVLGKVLPWIVIKYFISNISSQLNELPVAGYISNMQVKRHTALLRAFKVARSSEAKVCLSYLKTVGRVAHDLYALLRFLRQIVFRHQYAIALLSTSAYAPA